MENWLKGIASKAKGAVQSAEKTVSDWFAPVATGTRVRDVVREIPGATVNVAKDIARGVARVPLSAGEAIVSAPIDALHLAGKAQSMQVPIYKPEKIPGLGFLGPIESYQNQARREVANGASPLLAVGKAAGSVALDEPTGVALKPLGLAMGAFIKAGGGKAAQEGIDALVKAVKPEEVRSILEGFGIGKRAIDDTAEQLAKATTPEEVRGILTGRPIEPVKPAAAEVPRKTEAPAPADAPVSRETAPESVGSMQSMADLLKGKTPEDIAAAGGKPPKIPKEPKAPAAGAADGAERRFTKRVGEMDPNMQQYLDGKYKPRANEELIATADKQIAEDSAAAEARARTETNDEAVAIASRMIDNFVNEARALPEGVAKDALYEKAATIANDAAANLTEAGRAVQAASLLGRMTPEGMVRYAARQIQKYNEDATGRTLKNFLGGGKKIPNLSGEQAKSITDQMETINAMEDGIEKSKAIQKLTDEVKAYIPSSIYEKIITLWKAGLLTGLKTSGLNVLSNTSHAVSEIAKDVPSALVDRVVSLFTGKRSLALTTKGEIGGLKKGVASGWDYFRTGFDERDIGSKLDYSKVNFGTSPLAKLLQNYEETVFRTIGAQDQPFYYGAKARSLYSQAIAAAKNEGLKGKAAKDFIEQLVQEPTDDMLKYAVLDAETSVFQNKTALGKAAKAIQTLPGGQIVLPFGKTPAAVATQMINYSPVGIAKTIIENIGKGRFDQRLFSQGIGRGITGTAALAIGMALMGNKMMNLSYPTSEKEQKQWQLEGRAPNTILINGKWRNIGILGPLGMVLIVGGHLRDGIDQTGSWAGGLANAAGGAGSALTEQSFLKGVNQAIDALNDPKRSFEGFASSLAGSVIPTIIGDVARATDKYERRSESPIQRTISRIPGARRSLEPTVDTLGNKVETPSLYEVMADPTRPGNPTAPANDPVVKELRRLLDAGYNSTPTMLGDKKGYSSLTPEENTQLWTKGGQYTRAKILEAMNGRGYAGYDDEEKQKAIQKAVDDAALEARAHAVLEAVKGLTPEEKKAKLGEMKDDKLLTKSVYSYYQSLARKVK